MSLKARGSEPQHADLSQAIGARKSGDNQLHRFRVLEVRIPSPPAASLRTQRGGVAVACRSLTACSSRSPSKLGRHRRYAARRRDRRSLQANSDLFSWRCRVAHRPIRENATLRTQAVGTRHSLGRFGCGRVPERAQGSTQLLHPSPDFQRFVDYGVTHTSLDRRRMPQSPL